MIAGQMSEARHTLRGMKRLLVAMALAGALVGCSGEDEPDNASAPTSSASEESESAEPETSEPDPTPSQTAEAVPTDTLEYLATTGLHPDGFPYEVAVSELPDQVRSNYESQGYAEAVAVAEGVWAPIPPGATAYDAVVAGVFDGFCASIGAWEREYLDGIEVPGSCW